MFVWQATIMGPVSLPSVLRFGFAAENLSRSRIPLILAVSSCTYQSGIKE